MQMSFFTIFKTYNNFIRYKIIIILALLVRRYLWTNSQDIMY